MKRHIHWLGLVLTMAFMLTSTTASRAGEKKQSLKSTPTETREKRELREDICGGWATERKYGTDYQGNLGRLMDRWYERYHEVLDHMHLVTQAEEAALFHRKMPEHFPANVKVRSLSELCSDAE